MATNDDDMMDRDTECRTCYKTHPWPDGTMPKHPFNGTVQFKKKNNKDNNVPPAQPQEVNVGSSAFPFDPVLRLALIDRGVITSADLTDAESKLSALSNLVTKRVEAGR